MPFQFYQLLLFLCASWYCLLLSFLCCFFLLRSLVMRFGQLLLLSVFCLLPCHQREFFLCILLSITCCFLLHIAVIPLIPGLEWSRSNPPIMFSFVTRCSFLLRCIHFFCFFHGNILKLWFGDTNYSFFFGSLLNIIPVISFFSNSRYNSFSFLMSGG
jgi:hypothetical protein